MAATLVCYAFMVGEYVRGARLFAAPIAEAAPAAHIIRTPAQRKGALAAGGAFAWCSLRALRGTPLEDAAARTLLPTTAFRGPTSRLADAALDGDGGSAAFRFGARSARRLASRPQFSFECRPAGAAALQRLRNWDQLLIEALDVAADDPLLEGWREQVAPLPSDEVPSNVLESLPSLDGQS